MSNFVFDSFTDTAGTALESHTGETGATWTKNASGTVGGGGAVISAAGDVYASSSGTFTLYTASGTPPSADYTSEGVIAFNTGSATLAGVVARFSPTTNNGYLAYHDGTQWVLQKNAAPSFPQLGTHSQTLSTGLEYTLGLQCVGSTISLIVNGTTLISVTDTSFASAGSAGIYVSGNPSSTSGYLLDQFRAFPAVATLVVGNPAITSATPTAVTLSVSPTGGTSPNTYAWYLSGTANFTAGSGNVLAGQTASTLTLTASQLTAAQDSRGWSYVICKVTSTDGQIVTTYIRPVQVGQAALKVCAIGDSTSAINSGTQQAPLDYAVRKLRAAHGNRNVTAVNPAVSGSVTGGWVQGQANYTAARTACGGSFAGFWVLIRLSTNDAQGHIAASSVQANLANTIAGIQADGPAGIILSYPLYREAGFIASASTTFDDSTTPFLLQYMGVIDGLVDGTTVYAGDKTSYALFAQDPIDMMIDGPGRIHENINGGAVMGEAEADALLAILYPLAGASDVRSGVTSGGGVGTLIVPSPSAVLAGTATDHTVGTLDATPPDAVTGLSVTAISSTVATIAWTNSDSSDVQRYTVFSKRDTNSWTPNATPIVPPTASLNVGITAGHLYVFAVMTSDTSGNTSMSAPVTLDTRVYLDPSLVLTPNTYGTSGTATGTLTLTSGSNVLSGVVFRAGGTSVTGTSSGGGGLTTQEHGWLASLASVAAAPVTVTIAPTLGTTYPLSYAFTDPATGLPADVTLTWTATKSDGTVYTPAIGTVSHVTGSGFYLTSLAFTAGNGYSAGDSGVVTATGVYGGASWAKRWVYTVGAVAGGGGTINVGDTPVTSDTGGTDNLRFETSGGAGVGGAQVIAYVASEYAINPLAAAKRGYAITADDGTWSGMALDSGITYTFTFVQNNGAPVATMNQAV